MKKRLFSFLLALCMALSLLPMAALAAEGEPVAAEVVEEVAEPTPEPEPTVTPEPEPETAVESEAEATPETEPTPELEVTAEPEPESTPEPETTPEPEPEPTVEPEITPEPTPELPLESAPEDAAAAVQALIDALPESDSITADDYDAVVAQLEAIDDAKLALTDEQRDTLDFARYQAAIAALEALDGMAGASEPELLTNLSGSKDNMTWSNGEYKLTGNVSLKKGCTITVTGDVTLILNGKTLQYGHTSTTGDSSYYIASMIVVRSGATLTIKNESSSEGKISAQMQKNESDIACIKVEKGGTLNLYGGTISGNCYSGGKRTAGGVYVAGTFTMTGGKITDCYNYGSGALGVYVASGGTFNMSGSAVISGSSSNTNQYSAGGVCVDGGTFNMSGGAISGFTTTAAKSAGGVCVNSGTFNLSGGSISSCGTSADSAYTAGGVCARGGTFKMTGGSISYCTTTASGGYSAGGLYVGGGCTATITNGSIISCTSYTTNTAGGVYVGDTGSFALSGGTLSRCEHYITSADEYSGVLSFYSGAGAVYVDEGGSFTMSGSSAISVCLVVNKDSSSSQYGLANVGRVAGGVYNKGSFTMRDGTNSFCIFYRHSSGSVDYASETGLVNWGTMDANGGFIYGLYNMGTIQSTANNSTVFQNNSSVIYNYGTISGGTFYSSVNSGLCSIIDKTTTSYFKVYRGVISGGEFNESVINYTSITGGTFYSYVKNCYGGSGYAGATASISGGTFKGEVENDYRASISNGNFTGKVTNAQGASISGGTFSGTVNNNSKGTVSGGDFSAATSRINVCKISFDLNGGSGDTPATQWRYNASVAKPDDPTREGYKFLGWYNGEVQWNFADRVDSTTDITLTAQWERLPNATVTDAPKANSPTYTGAAQELVTAGVTSEGTLMYSTEKDGTYSKDIPTATSAGNYTVYYYVKADADHNDSAVGKVNVSILPKRLSADNVTVTDVDYVADTTQTPTVTVKDNDTTLTENTDYTVTFPTPTNAGVYPVTVTGTGNYIGTVTRLWRILDSTSTGGDDSDGTGTGTGTTVTPPTANSLTYTGEAQALVTADVTTGGTWNYQLNEDAEWSTDIPKVTDAGTYVVVYGIKKDDGEYEVKGSVSVTILPKAVSQTEEDANWKLSISIENVTYNGTAQTPTVMVKVGEKTINNNDYSCVYSSNTDAGMATVIVTSRAGSNYSFSESDTFRITPKTLNADMVTVGDPAYNGRSQTPTVTVTDNGTALTEGVDYSLTVTPQTNVGSSYTLTVTGMGNYSGKVEKTWAITPSATVKAYVTANSLTYTGAALPLVTASAVGGTLMYSTEKDGVYSETVPTATDAGEYTVYYYVEADANHKGNNTTAQKLSVTIGKRSVTLTSADGSKPYDGAALTAQTVTAENMADGEAFAYSFTGTQTAIGHSENRFAVCSGGTADMKNYDIVYEYGTLTVTVPEGIDRPVASLTVDKVTGDDRESIEDTLEQVKQYLDMEPSRDETAQLRELEETLEELLERLDDKQDALDSKTIGKVADIDESNVKSSDKKKLEKAKQAIEDLLDAFGGNLTEAERAALNASLDRIEAALKALDAPAKATAEASKSTAAQNQPPRTGDKAKPLLWLALALLAAAAIVPLAVRKKTK